MEKPELRKTVVSRFEFPEATRRDIASDEPDRSTLKADSQSATRMTEAV